MVPSYAPGDKVYGGTLMSRWIRSPMSGETRRQLLRDRFGDNVEFSSR